MGRTVRWAVTVGVVVFAGANPATPHTRIGSAMAMTHEQKPGNVESARAPVIIEVGNEHFEPGRTRIEVQGDGRALVTNRLEGKDEKGEARVDLARLEPTLREAENQMPRVAQRSMRRGLPDEPRYHIELEREGRRVTADLWRSELEEMPALHRLVRELEEVARRAVHDRLAM